MKRSKKLMVMALSLAIVVSAYFITVFITKKLDEKNAVIETEGAYAISEYETADIASVKWTYGGASYQIHQTNGAWTVDGDEDFPLDAEQASAMADTLSQLSGTRKLEGGLEKAAYGLDAPSVSVSVTLASGEQITYEQGDQNEVTSEYYMCAISDAEAVYTVKDSLAATFSKDLNDLFVYETVPTFGDFTSISLAFPDRAETLVYFADASKLDFTGTHHWFAQVNGEYRALDTTKVEELTALIEEFSWYDLTTYKADAQALTDYGFDAPSVTLTANYTVPATTDGGESILANQSFTVVIGGEYSSYYNYAKLPDSDTVYRVTDDLGDLAIAYTASGYAETLALGLDDALVSEISAQYAGEAHTLTRVQTEETVAAESTPINATPAQPETALVTRAYLDGAEIDASSFADLLSAFNALAATDVSWDTGDIAGARVLLATVKQANENFPEVSLDFYEHDADSYLALRSDGARMLVSAADVDKIVRTLKRLA